MSVRPFRKAVRPFYPALIGSMMWSPVVFADDRTETLKSSKSEDIVVTGSYLGGAGNKTANPVQIISAKDIQKTSAISLGDYLTRLPSVGSSGTPNTRTNGGGGVSCTDLRNLGQGRVLILIDGKRTAMNAGSECVDLNAIPVQQIDRIEILKDGGSELYGADAVSGVINIRLKHDLTGGNLTIKGGITQYGDSRSGLISGYKGFNFDHGRGNVTLFGQYDTTGPISSRDRRWAALPQNDNPASGAPGFGSSIIPSGVAFNPVTGKRMVPDGNGSFRAFQSSDLYNFAEGSMLQNYHQNAALSGDAHYDLNSHITLYSNVRYSHTTASRQLSPSPVQGSIPPSSLPSSWIIPADSPDNPWGKDYAVTKRMEDVGYRQNDFAVDTWTVIGGAKGHIVGDWQYDASMTYGVSQLTAQTQNMVNYRHLLETTGTEQLDPSSSSSAVRYNPDICVAASGCVLQNPFAPYSEQAANYARFTQRDHADYQMRDVNLRFHNNHVLSLPYRHGGQIGLAFGMEHRSEQLSYKPDPVVERGDSTGATTAYTGGGFHVTEGYVEGKIPLLEHAFLARDLTVDLQGRVSAYNTFGTTKNWKVGLHWAPVQDIAFRATLGTSYRQPSIYSLYGGRTLSYPSASDPCSQAGAYGARAGTVRARCLSEGINPETFSSAFVGQLPTLSGGNAALKPETGRTYTIGTVVTPHWVPHLSLSVEYWHYTLQNMISAPGTQYILDGCYTGTEPQLCSLVSPRSTSGQLTAISAVQQNLGGLRTNGLDIDLTYRMRLGRQDSLFLSENYQQLIGYFQQYTPGGAWRNYTGRLLYLSGSGMPRERSYTTVSWQHGAFSLTYMVQYIGGMHWNDGTNDLAPQTAGRTRSPGVFLQDVTVGYRAGRWAFNTGINNLFNRQPPFVVDGASNTAVAQYSGFIPGRYVFAQAGVDF
ncbi:TonB-dependent receptor domain-containing protein [Gluconobacter cerinus]